MWLLAKTDSLFAAAALITAFGIPTLAGLFLKWLTDRATARDQAIIDLRTKNRSLWEENSKLWTRVEALEKAVRELQSGRGAGSPAS